MGPHRGYRQGESVKGNSCQNSSHLYYFKNRKFPSHTPRNENKGDHRLGSYQAWRIAGTWVLDLPHLPIKISVPPVSTIDSRHGCFPPALDKEHKSKLGVCVLQYAVQMKFSVRGVITRAVHISMFTNLKLTTKPFLPKDYADRNDLSFDSTVPLSFMKDFTFFQLIVLVFWHIFTILAHFCSHKFGFHFQW